MTWQAMVAAVAGGLVAGGLALAVVGWRRQPPRPAAPSRRTARRAAPWARIPVGLRWAALAALLVGWVVALTTGWLVAVVLLPAAVLGLPAMLMVSDEARTINRLEAMSEWSRNLAGVMTAGLAIEGAIDASFRSTPEPIRPEVSRLVARIRSRWSTQAALRAFADDLDDATGDLLCAALLLGVSRRGEGLSRVLTGLADSVAEDVRARRQIEADRAKPRAVARQTTMISVLMLVGFGLTGPMLAPYGSVLGQVVLGTILCCYGTCLWWLRRLSVIAEPPRFLGAALRKQGPA